jgi:hypothetical protein
MATIFTQNVVFRDGDNFCKAIARAQVHIGHITSGKATSDHAGHVVMLKNPLQVTF